MRKVLAGLALFASLAAAVPAAEDALTPARYLTLKLEADALWEAGDREDAIPLYERLHAVNPADGDLAFRLARGLHEAGRVEEALPIGLAALEGGFADAAHTAYVLAQGAARQGDADAALAWIERALAEGWEDRPRLQTDEAFAGLVGDPRFQELAGIAPAGLDRVAGWRFDLDLFVEEAQRLHADPARPAFGEGFLAAVESLAERVPALDDVAVAMELQTIIATQLGDGHSVLYPLPSERVPFGGLLPVSFYFFPEGLHVVAADAGHEELVGMRVDAIGGTSTAGLLDDLATIVSHDNEMGIRWIGPLYLRSPAVLRALGAVDDLGPVTLTLTDRDGATREATLEPVPPRAMSERLPAPPRTVEPPRWLARAGEPYWHEAIPALDAVYLQLNQVRDAEEGPPIPAFAEAVRDALRATEARNLIIDVRHNNGGNNFLHWPLVRLVAWHGLAGEDHRTFVVTGRGTFSACQDFVNFLERATGAVFVGEPSSSRPNFAGEDTSVLLPWSGVRMSISSRWWQDSYPGDERPYIPVSMPVELTFEDWWTGRDPVMEALGEVLGEARKNREETSTGAPAGGS
jgi:tetratricopeptide (TPR) repeat protein